jgi:hypothetical protein
MRNYGWAFKWQMIKLRLWEDSEQCRPGVLHRTVAGSGVLLYEGMQKELKAEALRVASWT